MKSKLSILLVLTFILIPSCTDAQKTYNSDKPAYVIYNSNGKKVTYREMVRSLSSTDICFFGELHNDPISHWLELSLIKDFYELKKDKFVVGAEMWESDNQLLLNELMMDEEYVDMNTYVSSSVLWSNFSTDYLPILQYTKDNNIKFVATNVPRRYARVVSRRGDAALDSLSNQAKSYIAPLPIKMDLKDEFYNYIADVFKETQPISMTGGSLTNLVKSQMVKDATMAHFIVTNIPQDGFFFHFNGELHSAFNSGIGYYIKEYNPKLKFKTVSIINKTDIHDFSSKDSRADFNIVVPYDMSVTYEN